MFRCFRALGAAVTVLAVATCAPADETATSESSMQALVDQYATVRLTADVSKLSDNDQQVVRRLIEAVQYMDPIFWQETYGAESDALAKEFAAGLKALEANETFAGAARFAGGKGRGGSFEDL